MADPKMEPFIRWQGRSLEYLSYAINLFLGLSIAAIGFEMNLLQNKEFILVGWEKCIFKLSLLSLIISCVAGVFGILNRVSDFKETTAIARKKSKEEYDTELDELREVVGIIGSKTRKTFNIQVWSFSIGVLCLIIEMLSHYSCKLF